MTQNIRLGPQETKLLFSLERDGTSIFTSGDAKNILGGTDSAVWNVIGGLKRKKRLQKIENGRYLLIPAMAGIEGYWSEDPWIIVPRMIDEYYVGFWTAMKFWDMTEQIPYTVFVATPKRRKNRIVRFGNQKFQFVTVSRKKFFGYVEHKVGRNDHFNVSSREKTIVDGLAHPEYCGGIDEVTKAMWYSGEDADWDEVYRLSKEMGIDVVVRRLGYLLTVLGREENISEKIRMESDRRPYSFLDPTDVKKRISYSKEYRLILNMTKDELLGWMEY